MGQILCQGKKGYCCLTWRRERTVTQPRGRLSSETCELEAEAVTWLICRRNGITTRSKDYLSSLIQQAKHQDVSMFAIFDGDKSEGGTNSSEKVTSCLKYLNENNLDKIIYIKTGCYTKHGTIFCLKISLTDYLRIRF